MFGENLFEIFLTFLISLPYGSRLETKNFIFLQNNEMNILHESNCATDPFAALTESSNKALICIL